MLFAGHESFHIREGWIRKGLLAIADDPFFFSREDCVDQLGVGRNMVKAIRYWLRATQVADSTTEKVDGKATTHFTLTPLGQTVFEHDPYLEDRLVAAYIVAHEFYLQ